MDVEFIEYPPSSVIFAFLLLNLHSDQFGPVPKTQNFLYLGAVFCNGLA